MRRWSCLLMLFSCGALNAAESDPAASAIEPANVTMPGHSMLGEAFDEGPRRAANLLGTTGRVTLPITTSNPLVQQFFNQGLGQLHGFWYFEAERSFRQAAKLDPDCAMNYFGMALANVNNETRAKGFIAEAVKRKGKASDRERRYIDALNEWHKAEVGSDEKSKTRNRNYVKAFEEILYQFPEDVEAKAMLCLALWQMRSKDDVGSNFAIDAMANDVLAVNPYHPVHHYRIHLWDNDKARMAVNSAERCGLSAPGIAHMWHMSGHTFSKLERYFEAAWNQEASARTDHAYMMREGIFPDRIHNFAHNNEWLVKNMQYLGRGHDAIRLAKNTIDLPRHPKLNLLAGGKSAHFGRLRLFDTYTQFELWDALIADCQTQMLGPTDNEAEQVIYFRSLGRAYFRRNDVANGNHQLAILEHRLKRKKQDAALEIDNAVAKKRFDGGDAKAIEDAKKKATNSSSTKLKPLESAVYELQGYSQLAAMKFDEALASFKKSTDIDDNLVADVELLAGKPDDAIKRLRDRVGRTKNQVRPLAALVEMLWRQGKKEDARQSFEALREISGCIDLDLPPFARLTPIATEFGFSSDWRKPKPVAHNAAELPDLATLGPLTWQPTLAKEWSLPDPSEKVHSLAEFRQKPVILIFYLGSGCLHCVEQLQKFAAKQKAYTDAGISLIAITSESTQSLKKSLDRYQVDGGLPFLAVSDSSLETFKRYQAYDDFEETPLHATYLIDGSGLVRWHDIGPDPFMDVDFLLAEANRLLHPEQIELPREPELLDDNAPADAIAPRNVFPPASKPSQKPSAQPEIAKGN